VKAVICDAKLIYESSEAGDRGVRLSIVKDDAEKGTIDLKAAVIFYEAHFFEFVHK
jgi:hypothetical protein